MTNVTYSSRQDFATTMAKISAVTPFLQEHLPRTLAADSQVSFEGYLHEAMGYKKSTVEDALY